MNGKTRSLLLIFALAACSAQTTAHQPYKQGRIPPEEFKPVPSSLPIGPFRPAILEPAPYHRTEIVHRVAPTPPKSSVTHLERPQTPAKPRVVSEPTSAKAYALKALGSTQFSCLDNIFERESHWNPYDLNRSSGAYGIPQALPGSKMSSMGSDWRTNPITQVRWGINYVNSRYGSACGAWAFWQSHRWY